MSTGRNAVLVLALIAVVSSAVAAETEGTATRAVRRANETISHLLRAKGPEGSAEERKLASRLQSSVRGFLDVDELGRLALGRHWQSLSPRRRRAFLARLRSLIEENYLRGLRANLKYDVTYLGEDVVGENRIVRTQIRVDGDGAGRPRVTRIDYQVRLRGGSWRAYDVVTDGVGLVENYRAQFDRIIAKEGFDGLMRRMDSKLRSLQTQP